MRRRIRNLFSRASESYVVGGVVVVLVILVLAVITGVSKSLYNYSEGVILGEDRYLVGEDRLVEPGLYRISVHKAKYLGDTTHEFEVYRYNGYSRLPSIKLGKLGSCDQCYDYYTLDLIEGDEINISTPYATFKLEPIHESSD